MRYFGWFVLLLMAGEVASIVLMADWLGGVPTLLLMLLSFGAGLLMLRHLGFSSVMLAGALFRNQGAVSLYQLLWPLRYVLAALLLMSPGFVSTLLGLGLLLPIKAGPVAEQAGSQFGRRYGADDDVIDGDYEAVRPQPQSEAKPQETQYLEDKRQS